MKIVQKRTSLENVKLYLFRETNAFKVKTLFSFQISPTVENPNAYSKIREVLIQNGFLRKE